MAYILNKTNGSVLTTLSNGSIDTTTDLIFVGKNYAGYGEAVNEDLLKLLENFSNNSAPTKPITGQLWYDSSAQILKVYDGSEFRNLSSSMVSEDLPAYGTFNTGDFWWDSRQQVLNVFNGTEFIAIGPNVSGLGDYLLFTKVVDNTVGNPNNKHSIIENKIYDDLVAVVSSSTFYINTTDYTQTDDLIYNQTDWNLIRKGITIPGADPVTGVSSPTGNEGSIFWGTAADAIRLNGVLAEVAAIPNTIVKRSTDGSVFANSITAGGSASVSNNIHVGNTATIGGDMVVGGGVTIGSTSTIAGDLYGVMFHGIATSAYYADLAERYHADARYDEGTVLVIGGVNEVTVTEERANVAVAGIVSKKPAYMMNSEAGTDETHPYIALKGRVLCKVIGPVSKGDLLVTSGIPGFAMVRQEGDSCLAVIGKALGECPQGFEMVEVKV